MKLRQALKEMWDKMKDPYHRFNPAPDVKEKLEQQGWQFETAITYHFPTPCYNVYTPEGELVAGMFRQPHMDRYDQAYKKAVEYCAAKKAQQEPEGPEPK